MPGPKSLRQFEDTLGQLSEINFQALRDAYCDLYPQDSAELLSKDRIARLLGQKIYEGNDQTAIAKAMNLANMRLEEDNRFNLATDPEERARNNRPTNRHHVHHHHSHMPAYQFEWPDPEDRTIGIREQLEQQGGEAMQEYGNGRGREERPARAAFSPEPMTPMSPADRMSSRSSSSASSEASDVGDEPRPVATAAPVRPRPIAATPAASARPAARVSNPELENSRKLEQLLRRSPTDDVNDALVRNFIRFVEESESHVFPPKATLNEKLDALMGTEDEDTQTVVEGYAEHFSRNLQSARKLTKGVGRTPRSVAPQDALRTFDALARRGEEERLATSTSRSLGAAGYVGADLGSSVDANQLEAGGRDGLDDDVQLPKWRNPRRNQDVVPTENQGRMASSPMRQDYGANTGGYVADLDDDDDNVSVADQPAPRKRSSSESELLAERAMREPRGGANRRPVVESFSDAEGYESGDEAARWNSFALESRRGDGDDDSLNSENDLRSRSFYATQRTSGAIPGVAQYASDDEGSVGGDNFPEEAPRRVMGQRGLGVARQPVRSARVAAPLAPVVLNPEAYDHYVVHGNTFVTIQDFQAFQQEMRTFMRQIAGEEPRAAQHRGLEAERAHAVEQLSHVREEAAQLRGGARYPSPPGHSGADKINGLVDSQTTLAASTQRRIKDERNTVREQVSGSIKLGVASVVCAVLAVVCIAGAVAASGGILVPFLGALGAAFVIGGVLTGAGSIHKGVDAKQASNRASALANTAKSSQEDLTQAHTKVSETVAGIKREAENEQQVGGAGGLRPDPHLPNVRNHGAQRVPGIN